MCLGVCACVWVSVCMSVYVCACLCLGVTNSTFYCLSVCLSVCLSQVCIMKMLRHEHVVRYYGERKVGDFHYIFLEYADGGELFDRIGMAWWLSMIRVVVVEAHATALN